MHFITIGKCIQPASCNANNGQKNYIVNDYLPIEIIKTNETDMSEQEDHSYDKGGGGDHSLRTFTGL